MSDLGYRGTPEADKRKSILELTADEARAFFLKQESYCSMDLPPYFVFDDLLARIDAVLGAETLASMTSRRSRDCEDVNHLILNNKDGRHAWRPLELIHPALYVSLIRRMTEADHWKTICNRFAKFSKTECIKCLSIPVEALTEVKDKEAQILQWWQEIEQRSIELGLDFEYMVHTDITNCYGDIYTHSIAWAIHGKGKAKAERWDDSLIGNVIDTHIQDMRHGQTNGIPQGSALMDFIAEMVLGYADLKLSAKIGKQGVKDYLILRYRDDYRIFVNNLQDGDKILKCLTEVLITLGLRLNASKTKLTNLVIREAIKPDKFAWMTKKQRGTTLQKHAFLIYGHSLEFPNSGSVSRALNEYYRLRMRYKGNVRDPLPLISIIVDIAYRNPRTYPICAAILSKLLSSVDSKQEKKAVVKKIHKRFSQIPNTGHMEIWLQRITLPYAPEIPFKELLCHLVKGDCVEVWNSDWISSAQLKAALSGELIIDRERAQKIDPVIPLREVSMFMTAPWSYE